MDFLSSLSSRDCAFYIAKPCLNISFLTKVYKNNQFVIKIVVFIIVLRFIGIKLS